MRNGSLCPRFRFPNFARLQGCVFVGLFVFLGACSEGELEEAFSQAGQEQSSTASLAHPFIDEYVLVAGEHHNCLLSAKEQLRCWGKNGLGVLGQEHANHIGDDPGEMGAALKETLLGGTAEALSAGFGHNCVLLKDGRVKCWGANLAGELGLGNANARGNAPREMGPNLLAVPLGTNFRALHVVAGGLHSCATSTESMLKCWGNNSQGQLGLGDTQNRGDHPSETGNALPTVKLGGSSQVLQISLGGLHTCAILLNDTLKCWGNNSQGQLGLGNNQNRGDLPNQMDAALPVVLLGGDNRVKQISAGYTHTCAILLDDTLKCWGNNLYGQLGVESTQQYGTQAVHMGNALPAVDLGAHSKVKSVVAGYGHSCAILGQGQLKCWGLNGTGQLGLGDYYTRGNSLGEMGDALPPVDLGLQQQVRAVALGRGHSCALLSDASIKCWGRNRGGQLGLGDTRNRGSQGGGDPAGPNYELGEALPKLEL